MDAAKFQEYNIINHNLKNGIILTCNNYKHYTKDEIMVYAGTLSKILDAKGVITIGWNSDNPQLCLNLE